MWCPLTTEYSIKVASLQLCENQIILGRGLCKIVGGLSKIRNWCTFCIKLQKFHISPQILCQCFRKKSKKIQSLIKFPLEFAPWSPIFESLPSEDFPVKTGNVVVGKENLEASKFSTISQVFQIEGNLLNARRRIIVIVNYCRGFWKGWCFCRK